MAGKHCFPRGSNRRQITQRLQSRLWKEAPEMQCPAPVLYRNVLQHQLDQQFPQKTYPRRANLVLAAASHYWQEAKNPQDSVVRACTFVASGRNGPCGALAWRPSRGRTAT
jgi:hypothetical protein